MTQCLGYWKSDQNDEKFDDYLKEIGMGFAYRKISKLITTWEEIRHDGNVWSFDIYASIRHGKHVYIVGEELEETTLDGRHVRSRLEIEDDKIIIYQKSLKNGIPDVKFTRVRTGENTLNMDYHQSAKHFCPDQTQHIVWPDLGPSCLQRLSADNTCEQRGIGFANRKISKLITSYEDISQDGDTWTIHIHASIRNGTHVYNVGEEVEETTLDGRDVRSTLEIEDDKLVITQRSRKEGIPDVKVTRIRTGDNTLNMVIETKTLTSIRTYLKQEKKS